MNPEKDTIRCTYGKGGKMEDNPHIHDPFRPEPKKIYEDVLDAVGNTPMVKINKVGLMDDIQC